jgi:uncharacterized membrane protein
MDNPYLLVAMRYIHILSAMILVGGLVFDLFCVKPALRVIDDSLRDSITAVIRKQFFRLQIIGIAGLLISGIFNWVISAATYRDMGAAGNALIGIKVLLALAVFAVVFLRSTNMIKSDKAAKMINIHLVTIIVLLAAILRYLRLAHLAG